MLISYGDVKGDTGTGLIHTVELKLIVLHYCLSLFIVRYILFFTKKCQT